MILAAAGVQHLNTLQAVLLGLLQGLTEFLPVSSTAHMDVVPQLFGLRDPGSAFSAVVQLGPIVAIIWYFRRDLARYVAGIVRTKSPAKVKPDDLDARLGWYTILGTIPLALFGLLLEHKIDTSFRRLHVVAISLIALAIVLWMAERVNARRKRHPLDKMTFRESQVVGWAQVLALVPGTSRSGVTITAGLFQGLDRESAARFSFLLSIPAITAAGLYKLLKARNDTLLHDEVGQYIMAAVVAGIFAYVVITWFLKYVERHNTGVFIAYRILAGIAILVMLQTGRIVDNPHTNDQSAPLPHPASRVMPISRPAATGALPTLPNARSADSPRLARLEAPSTLRPF